MYVLWCTMDEPRLKVKCLIKRVLILVTVF